MSTLAIVEGGDGEAHRNSLAVEMSIALCIQLLISRFFLLFRPPCLFLRIQVFFFSVSFVPPASLYPLPPLLLFSACANGQFWMMYRMSCLEVSSAFAFLPSLLFYCFLLCMYVRCNTHRVWALWREGCTVVCFINIYLNLWFIYTTTEYRLTGRILRGGKCWARTGCGGGSRHWTFSEIIIASMLHIHPILGESRASLTWWFIGVGTKEYTMPLQSTSHSIYCLNRG